MAGEGDSTYTLQHWVRDRGKIRLEQAVKRITSDLARDVGLKQRGAVAEGYFADLVIFDAKTVARGPQIAVEDVPGGGFRFVHHATGIDKTIINGKVAVDNGVYTEERSGQLV
jgi:N-acyl-D-aspartate/D-glutamate deacylase